MNGNQSSLNKKASLFCPLEAIFQPLFAIIFKAEIFRLTITEITTHKPTTQVIRDLLPNSLKVGTSFGQVNEWVQQPVKQQVGGSWRRMKEEELLKGTAVDDISELIFLPAIVSAQ